MATDAEQFKEFEGRWEDLIRLSEHFAGQHVRLTVLAEENSSLLQEKLSQWFEKVEAMEIRPVKRVKPDPYGDALVEKCRKQGLII